jgi:hypothetical protein
MKTLLLDQVVWDLVLDASGNIALAAEPYSIAQDVASAVKLFLGELWYDTTKGVPYWQQILGQWPPLELVRQKITDAALTVPDVVQARTIITAFTNRQLSGQVQCVDSTGANHNVSF